MRTAQAQHLRDPATGEPLSLEAFRSDGDEVIEGVLRARSSPAWYPVIDGVPRLLLGSLRAFDQAFVRRHGLVEGPAEADAREAARAEQARTNTTFSDKWRRFQRYGLEPAHAEFLFGWYCKKLGLPDVASLRAFHAAHRTVLEVGPGSGFNTRFMAECNAPAGGTVFAADISDAALTTHQNIRHLPNACAVQADLMNLPFPDGAFDFAIADGVLHHTPDTRAAVEAVFRKVRPGGRFFFYVYRRMGAARYFVDQHIREHFMGLEPEACYQRCEGLTELGRELSRLKAKVTLTKGVPELGIPPGEHDVQRLLYYNFVKCFWNEAFDWETNNMVNFDWYHPHNAWQHTDDEVRGWLRDLGVRDYAFNDANPNGISCLLTRPATTTAAAR